MKHLIISRELPPAPYAAGGIGTYVANIARLLADAGDTVHLIGQRWEGASTPLETRADGRLIIHRIGPSDVPPVPPAQAEHARRELRGLRRTEFPQQWFAWSAAWLAERLVEQEGVDIIEAQEWEAPLYYFLLRRSLGLGPQRQPPCIVHLHSPSVLLHHYNGAAETIGGRAIERMEAFCIRTADALLCPSRSLAAEAARRFEVPADRVEVIPLPVGFTAPQAREPAVWAEGSICFVGRLEPRKGVIEWVEAACRLAPDHPGLRFDFVGADVAGLGRALRRRIGRELAPRFRFHGPKPSEQIAAYLARARAGVVPSRWENFPNVCIEAMASGLPVIATPYGAMSDLIEDGRSGWLAPDYGVAGMADGLAEALGRCLACPPQERAAMGARASERVRRICENGAVVAAHQRFRASLAASRPARDVVTPASESPARLPAQVVVAADTLFGARGVMASLQAQTTPPHTVALVCRRGASPPPDSFAFGAATGLVLLHAPGAVGAQAWNRGFAQIGPRAAGFWLFLDEHDRLEADCLELMTRAFASRPDLGVVSPWTERSGRGGGLDARPNPGLPHQLTGNDVAPASGFNAAALGPAPPFQPGLPREYDVWALANTLLARGWGAATLPGLLAQRAARLADNRLQATALRAIRAEALQPFDTAENQLALQLVGAFVPVEPDRSPGSQRMRRRLLWLAQSVLLRPGHLARRCLGMTRLLLMRGALVP